jgi:hypothetical protein
VPRVPQVLKVAKPLQVGEALGRRGKSEERERGGEDLV